MAGRYPGVNAFLADVRHRLISVAAMPLGALLHPLVIALLILVAVALMTLVRPGHQPGSAA